MCAIDALGISAMLGRPVTITAADPGTGRIITVHADRDRTRGNPPRTVVFAGTTGGDCCHAADRTCGYINFFTSARAARTWAHANPFFFQAEDGIRDHCVTGVQTCALPI